MVYGQNSVFFLKNTWQKSWPIIAQCLRCRPDRHLSQLWWRWKNSCFFVINGFGVSSGAMKGFGGLQTHTHTHLICATCLNNHLLSFSTFRCVSTHNWSRLYEELFGLKSDVSVNQRRQALSLRLQCQLLIRTELLQNYQYQGCLKSLREDCPLSQPS